MAEKGAARFRWLRGLSLTLQILFWIVIALEGLAAALWLASLFVPASNVPYNAMAIVACVTGAAPYLLAMLILPVWTAVVAAARPRRKRDGLRLWAWLGYLVPGVCYVAPALVFRGLIHEAAPQDGHLRVLVLAFWSLRLATTFLGAFLLAVLCVLVLGSDAERSMPIWMGFLTVCTGAASVFGVRLVTRLSRAVVSYTTGTEQSEVF